MGGRRRSPGHRQRGAPSRLPRPRRRESPREIPPGLQPGLRPRRSRRRRGPRPALALSRRPEADRRRAGPERLPPLCDHESDLRRHRREREVRPPPSGKGPGPESWPAIAVLQKRLPFPFAAKKVALIVNPLAANGRWLRRPKLRAFVDKHFSGCVHDRVYDKAGMIAQAERLARDNEILIVFGGDGTIADVMQGLANAGRLSDVVLGVIPFGSGNAFSSSLRIPKKLRRAVRALVRGEPRPIDLISVEGRIANFVSVGAIGRVVQLKEQSLIPGLIGHLLAGLSLFTTSRDVMEIELIDGLDDRRRPFERKVIRRKLFDVVVNKTNHFGYSWLIAPFARINDGFLDVTLFDIRATTY
ncbi:MAG: hypothetical protein FJY80_13235, partial [Candidatus Aminicenantes bacterium]|nr:hypothetical protein [Candidatus Aminicenantes bacterium]